MIRRRPLLAGLGGGVLVRGIRWRATTSVLVVVVAMVAFAAAFVAPLFLRSAQDSVVRATISDAPVPAVGAQLGGVVSNVTPTQLAAAEARVVDAGGVHRWFGEPITSIVTGGVVTGSAKGIYHATLYSRTGICAHLVFVAGGCDLGVGSVAVSDRSAAVLGVSTGDSVQLSIGAGNSSIRLRVAGVYAIPGYQASYWWGDGPGIFEFGAIQGPNHLPSLDPFVAAASTALTVPGPTLPQVSGQVPLLAGRINLSTESRFERDLSRVTAQAGSEEGVVVASGAPGLLAGAGHQRHVMSTIVATVAVQLVVLALWVLASLVVRSSEARQAELRLARLRGFPWPSALGVLAAEPAALCAIALPLSVAMAWGVVAVSRARLFAPHTSIQVDGWVWVAGIATVAGITSAVLVGAARVYRMTALGSPTGGGRRRSPRWRTRSGVIVDVVVLVLASAAVVELDSTGAFAGGRTDPLAAAGPGLIALGISVIAVQVVLLVARIIVGLTSGSARVAVFLAARQVARRPVLLRQARVLVVALCLVCFASAAWSEARSDRSLLAAFETGSSQVVTVTAAPGVDPEAVVDHLDPTGRYAMAAALISTSSTTLLGVDPGRLSRVAAWPADISSVSLARIARFLSPPTAPEVHFRGTTLQVDARASGAATAPGVGRVDLNAWVYNLADQATSVIDLGPVRAGAAVYSASLGASCMSTCRLTGVSLVPTPLVSPGLLSSGTTALAVMAVAAGGPPGSVTSVDADLSGRGWSAKATGVTVTFGTPGPILHVSAAALAALAAGVTSQTPPMAGPADLSTTLPAVITATQAAINGGGEPGTTIPSQGLDGNVLTLAPVLQALTLPQVGADGAVTNLELLERAQTTDTIPGTSYQVWLGRKAPADILGLLNRAGLHVESVQRAATIDRQLATSGPALADDFLFIAAVAALVVAALSTLAALAATTRERTNELASLQAAGVRRASLLWSLLGETIALAATALFGTLAGVISILIVVPSLPILAATPAGAPPLQHVVPLGVVGVVSAAVIGAVVAGGLVAHSAVARRAATKLATMDIP